MWTSVCMLLVHWKEHTAWTAETGLRRDIYRDDTINDNLHAFHYTNDERLSLRSQIIYRNLLSTYTEDADAKVLNYSSRRVDSSNFSSGSARIWEAADCYGEDIMEQSPRHLRHRIASKLS